MKTLYIIGNGFDLWHGLPTSYGNFYEFAQETLDELENHYSFELHQFEPWHDFENALGAFDADGFFDFYNEVDIGSESFRPKDLYGLEDELTEQTDMHVSTIQETFVEWVSQIDVTHTEPQMVFAEDAQFISFNYTSTLQEIYGVDDGRIFHIHGRAETHDELIFGHGEEITELPEFDEDGESTRSMFSDAESAARYPLYALKKPVAEVLARNERYFDELLSVEEIQVIGHSLNPIDLPYFCRIAETAVNAKWVVYCYAEEEEELHIQSLIDCGVSPERIKVMSFEELSRSDCVLSRLMRCFRRAFS